MEESSWKRDRGCCVFVPWIVCAVTGPGFSLSDILFPRGLVQFVHRQTFQSIILKVAWIAVHTFFMIDRAYKGWSGSSLSGRVVGILGCSWEGKNSSTKEAKI